MIFPSLEKTHYRVDWAVMPNKKTKPDQFDFTNNPSGSTASLRWALLPNLQIK
jgi:hypothetical protein